MNKIKCPICHKLYESLLTHIKTHGYSDCKLFKKQFGLDFLVSEDIRKRQKDFMHKHNNSIGGRSDETKRKISEAKKGKGVGKLGKYERTPEIRKKISNSVTNLYLNGTYNSHGNFGVSGIKGWVFSSKMNTNIHFDSTWEKRLIRYFDLCPRITKFKHNPFKISYYYDGSLHNYVPDYLVTYDETIQSIWEVKRQDMLDYDDKTIEKMYALEEYAFKNHYNVIIITLKDLEKLETHIEQCSAEELDDYDKYCSKYLVKN